MKCARNTQNDFQSDEIRAGKRKKNVVKSFSACLSFCSGSVCWRKFIRRCAWIWKAIISHTKCPSMKYFPKMYGYGGWIDRLTDERRSRCARVGFSSRLVVKYRSCSKVRGGRFGGSGLLFVPSLASSNSRGTFKVVSASQRFIGSSPGLGTTRFR